MNKKGMIIFDMDDTLVNREDVYTKAQKFLLKTLKKYGAKKIDINKSISVLRKIDYKLVTLHKGEFMYDYKELAKALWLYYVEEKSLTEACHMAFQEGKRGICFKPAVEAAEKHNQILKTTIPKLKKNAFEVLKKLQRSYVLVLLSVGNIDIQNRVIDYYKFDRIFDLILIRPRKDINVFKEAKERGAEILARKYSSSASNVYVVGDMISQDILFGKCIGAKTIWIPGPYDPCYKEGVSPDYKISDLSELLGILSP